MVPFPSPASSVNTPPHFPSFPHFLRSSLQRQPLLMLPATHSSNPCIHILLQCDCSSYHQEVKSNFLSLESWLSSVICLGQWTLANIKQVLLKCLSIRFALSWCFYKPARTKKKKSLGQLAVGCNTDG